MKKYIVVLGLLVFAGWASAQEPIPRDQVQKMSLRVARITSNFLDLQLKFEPDIEKAMGMLVKKFAAIVIPATDLTGLDLEKAGGSVVPLGQLWLVRLAPAKDVGVFPNDQLRLVTVTIKDEDHDLPLLLLGAGKNSEGKMELLVYARDKEPLLRLPLEKNDTKQEDPIELLMRPGGPSIGLLDIYVLGKYRATLPMGEQLP